MNPHSYHAGRISSSNQMSHYSQMPLSSNHGTLPFRCFPFIFAEDQRGRGTLTSQMQRTLEREITNFKSEMFDLYKRLSSDVRASLETTSGQFEKKFSFQVAEHQERVQTLGQSIGSVSSKIQGMEGNLKREIALNQKGIEEKTAIQQSVKKVCQEEIENSFKREETMLKGRKVLEEKALRHLKEFQTTWELKLANVFEQLNQKIKIVETNFDNQFEQNGEGFGLKGNEEEVYDKMDAELAERYGRLTDGMEKKMQEIREELAEKLSKGDADERIGISFIFTDNSSLFLPKNHVCFLKIFKEDRKENPIGQ
jgi:hypothetical protein